MMREREIVQAGMKGDHLEVKVGHVEGRIKKVRSLYKNKAYH